jgi:phospholipid transport system transporter-binding protein
MLVLPATLTHRNARDTLNMLTQAMSREAQALVTLDATGLEQFDTSVLAVLLACKRQTQAAGKRLTLAGCPEKLLALARLYGVEALLEDVPA